MNCYYIAPDYIDTILQYEEWSREDTEIVELNDNQLDAWIDNKLASQE